MLILQLREMYVAFLFFDHFSNNCIRVCVYLYQNKLTMISLLIFQNNLKYEAFSHLQKTGFLMARLMLQFFILIVECDRLPFCDTLGIPDRPHSSRDEDRLFSVLEHATWATYELPRGKTNNVVSEQV